MAQKTMQKERTMPQHEYDHRYVDPADLSHPAEVDPVEGLDQWQLADFEDLLPRPW